MRVGFVLVLLLLSASPVHAQNADLKNIWRQVTSGDVVRVKEASGHETRGIFTKISESSVGVLVDGKALDIPTSDIREIRRRGDSPLGGLILGASIGAGAAMALFYKCDDVTKTACMDLTRGTILGAAVGAGIGTFVDTAIRGWTVAFRDNGTSFVLAPAILPTPRGMAATIQVRIGGI